LVGISYRNRFTKKRKHLFERKQANNNNKSYLTSEKEGLKNRLFRENKGYTFKDGEGNVYQNLGSKQRLVTNDGLIIIANYENSVTGLKGKIDIQMGNPLSKEEREIFNKAYDYFNAFKKEHKIDLRVLSYKKN